MYKLTYILQHFLLFWEFVFQKDCIMMMMMIFFYLNLQGIENIIKQQYGFKTNDSLAILGYKLKSII